MRSSVKWCMRIAVLMLCLMLALPVSAAGTELETECLIVAVRSRPSQSASIIGWLSDGQPVTVCKDTDDYYQIDCFDMTGYVHKSLVTQREAGFCISADGEHADTEFRPALPQSKIELLQNRLIQTAMSLRGVPYVWGGTSPRGFDCSGFTQYVYLKNGLSLPRSCNSQFSAGMIVSKEELQPGDLILFQNTGSARGLSHVGMYVGDGKLIHAGSKGITVVELANSYFTRHYLCARRILIGLAVDETPAEEAAEVLFVE